MIDLANSTLAPDPGPREGWTSSPNARGTIDIIWNCLLTVFLCTWTVLCLNVPTRGEGWYARIKRKARWSALAIFGPEFLISFAIGQYTAAKRSLAAFKAKKYQPWSLRHAYYANMGGFMLRTPAHEPFPINATHIYWLVDNKFMDMPAIEEGDIEDKSKADTLAKILTVIQTVWFLLQSVGRIAQGLAFTTLELATLAFVFCTLPTYYFWLNKPLDVMTPTELRCEFIITDMLRFAEVDPAKPFQQTPLDFIDNNLPSWSSAIASQLGFKTQPPKLISRIRNDRLPNINGTHQLVLFLVTMFYSAIHLLGWNFSFASQLEQYLWRACGLTQAGGTFCFWVIDRHASWHKRGFYARAWRAVARFIPYWRQSSRSPKPSASETPKPALPTVEHTPQRNESVTTTKDVSPGISKSPSQEDMDLYLNHEVPTYELVVMTIATLLYTVARIYLIIEIFVGLRSLPASAYVTVQWSNFIPHF